jgi:hypothetical protein
MSKARDLANLVPPSGQAVGTTDAQTLTNKTVSADSNTLSGLAASSFVLSDASGNIDGAAAQKAIPSGVVVGDTDAQTLTNKTLQTPNITSGLTLNGAAGSAGQTILSQGAGQPPIWGTTSSASSGITTASPMSSNITLTNSSTQVQNVAPNAENLSVYLPNATTITSPNNPVFIVRNTATLIGAGSNAYAYDVCVRRQDGSLVAIINPGGEALISLTNNATARGEWRAVGNKLSWSRFFGATGTSSNSEPSIPPVTLTNGNFVIGYYEYIIYATKTGNANYNSISGKVVGIYEIDSTHLFVVSTNGSTIYSYYVTINDTSLSFSSATTKSFTSPPAGGSLDIVASQQWDASTYVFVWGLSGSLRGLVITLSGSSITYGSEQTLKTGSGIHYLSRQSLLKYSSTALVCVHSQNSSDPMNFMGFVITVSGTTITAGTSVTLYTETGYGQTYNFSWTFMQNGSGVAMHWGNGGGALKAVAFTVSGTTITAGSSTTVYNTYGPQIPIRQFSIDASTALYVPFTENENIRYWAFSVSGTTITARYNGQNADTQASIVRNNVTGKLFTVYQVPQYEQYKGMFGSAANGTQIWTFGSTAIEQSQTVYVHGDLIGPNRDSAGNGTYTIVCATSGGILYSYSGSTIAGITSKVLSWDGSFTENYGQASNPIPRNWSTDNFTTSISLPIDDGITMIKSSSYKFAFVEMVV